MGDGVDNRFIHRRKGKLRLLLKPGAVRPSHVVHTDEARFAQEFPHVEQLT